jgi:hypothetical protein
MDKDGTFAVCHSVSRELAESHPEYFQHVRRDFSRQLTEHFVEPMIDDGLYHVIRADIMRDETFDAINFYLRVHHSVAQVRHVEFMQMDAQPVRIPETAKLACRYCGNVLNLDARGGCSACGAPAGRSYVN